MQRTMAAKAVAVAAGVACLAVWGQAVRFAMGDISNVAMPVFEFISHALSQGPTVSPSDTPTNPISELIEGYKTVLLWLAGFGIWIGAGAAIAVLGNNLAGILSLGWRQYRIEQREAREIARIAAERQAAKDRRRELRRKVLEAREPRKSSGALPFLMGLLLGSFFF
ncbi:hypothetical protein NWJ54_004527 [Salmonella enterica]|nr:hypothetical protein [Salmonella enterica]